MTCYLCGSNQYVTRMGNCRDNPDIFPFECASCGLVYLSKQVAVDYTNTCLHETELNADDKRRADYIHDITLGKSLLDFGSGNSNFLWYYARWTAKNAAGLEPCLLVKERIVKDGEPKVPIYRSLAEIDRKFDVITMFHTIEHLLDPRTTLIELRKKLNIGGTLIIETPNSNDVLLSLYRCKEFAGFTYWTCHPFLYNENTLAELIRQAGFEGGDIQHIQRYPLSNHLCWLAEGKPNGHNIWGYLDSREYERNVCMEGISDTIIGRFR